MERIITATAISAASRTAPAPGALKKWLRHTGLKVIESAYSQDRELEADTLGFRLITAAGCDRNAPVKMFTRLKNLNQTENQPLLTEYFSSHPQFNQRIQNINSLLQARKKAPGNC
jgi:predicted Zn-dependent protease